MQKDVYQFTVLNKQNIFSICAYAAGQSYNLDIHAKTEKERQEYVSRIWDEHTNVSEHATLSILFTAIPRWATLIMALQRDGFTMTELSQRRNVVSYDEEYQELLQSSVKKEDARIVLPLSTMSSCVVTLNRESAKNIVRTFRTRFPDLQPPPLNQIFSFDFDEKQPLFAPEILFREHITNGTWGVTQDQKDKNTFVLRMPMYSLHQFIRHRKILLHQIVVYSQSKQLPDVLNKDYCDVTCSSFCWDLFVRTRRGKSTQEPLRSIAISIDSMLSNSK